MGGRKGQSQRRRRPAHAPEAVMDAVRKKRHWNGGQAGDREGMPVRLIEEPGGRDRQRDFLEAHFVIVLGGVPVKVELLAMTMFQGRLGRRRGPALRPMRSLMEDDRRLRGHDRDRGDQRAGYRNPRTAHRPVHGVSYNPCASACQPAFENRTATDPAESPSRSPFALRAYAKMSAQPLTVVVHGRVTERLKVAVSKTARDASPSRVRIPPLPPF